MQAQGHLRLIENYIRLRRLRLELTQRCDVVEHPKRAAMSGNNQIVIFHYEVVNG